MKYISATFAVFLTLALSACTQIGLSAINLPSRLSGNVQIEKNVSFGPEPWETLDIYRPADIAKNEKLPVIVFFYGGRWESGAKEDYRFVGARLAAEGFVVVIPDYRKYPVVKFPVFVEDAAKSLAWTYDHIGDHGGDPKRLHLSGHSAGGHIAALLATDARYLKAMGKDRAIIRDVTGIAGPYSFDPEDDDLKDMFGPPENYPQMQATTFIDGKQPPMLLFWGEKDTYVKHINLDRMIATVKKKGGCLETRIYPDLGHIDAIVNLSWVGPKNYALLYDWLAFLRRTKACPTGALK